MIALLGATLLGAGVCPVSQPVPGEAGLPRPVHVPLPQAQALNGEGRTLYKQGRWEEARAKYHAASSVDPEFLAPALNIACSFARQERFAEAAHEASALIRRAHTPWTREVLEAADLATLHLRPEMSEVRAAISQAARDWAQALTGALLFVARTRPAIRTRGEGTLVLGVNQEIFAWLPRTGRYRQLTSDDGRVIAFVRSDDGRTVTYLRAGKLVRKPGASLRLRGLSVRQLDVPTMTLGAPVDLPGDAESLSLWATKGSFAEVLVARGDSTASSYRVVGSALVPLSIPSPETRARRPVKVSGRGVQDRSAASGDSTCPFKAADERRPGVAPSIRVRSEGGAFTLSADLGAGLFGLPFAEEEEK